MREAAAALAETETVLKTRKDALIARHVDGRESLNDLDRIFQGKEQGGGGFGGGRRRPEEDIGSFDHYLESRRRLGEGGSRDNGLGGGLYDLNSRLDKEFGVDAESSRRKAQ